MMGKRYVSLWFPRLSTDYLINRKPDLEKDLFVLTLPVNGKIEIVAVNESASKQGVHVGMSLADAKAIYPNIKAFDDDQELNKKMVLKLGKWCIRFSPVVSLAPPDGLIMDCSGCTHLWGGEKKYLETIIGRLKDLGYTCKAAIADTIGTAWAISHYGKNVEVISSHFQHEALAPLPPRALRINSAITDRLHKLGFYKIGQFLQMPKSILRRRFGEELLLKMGQAIGTAEESIKPLIVNPPYEERLPCLDPIRTNTGIEIAIRKLLEVLCLRLSKDGMGIRNAVLIGYRIDGKLTQIHIGTSSPTHDVEHLCKLFELKITKFEPALGIELFSLTASKTDLVVNHQEKFWDGKPGLEDQGLAQLLDRIAGKLGEQTIRRYLPDAHYWPERSLKTTHSLVEKPTVNWCLNPRPIELLSIPERITVTAPIPDYPPMNFRYKDVLHLVKKADGPERIEREWWLENGEHRDYYIVEDENGKRYWLFRSGHYSAEKNYWFIHGFFA